jgi:hypothetical protein
MENQIRASAWQAAEKLPRNFVIPSDARNLSFFSSEEPVREIPRFARNDKIIRDSTTC